MHVRERRVYHLGESQRASSTSRELTEGGKEEQEVSCTQQDLKLKHGKLQKKFENDFAASKTDLLAAKGDVVHLEKRQALGKNVQARLCRRKFPYCACWD